MSKNNGYSQIIFEEVRNRISQNHPNFIHKNKHFQKLTCPVCQKEEAWAYYDKPLSIICPRANQCGAITPIKELYPDCFKNLAKKFPSSKKDPHATAKAYLISRGLNPSKTEFTQWEITDKDDKKTYPTVQFKVDKEVTFHRLIDYSGKNKTRIFGEYKGKVWKPKDFDYSKKTWIVESVLDAITLIQSDLQAIATLSSSHLPKDFYQEHSFLNTSVVLAFDNDNAGKKAIQKHIDFFKETKKENYEVALPPHRKDWNDLLLLNAFSKENLENTISDSLWRGRLHQASSPEQYFKTYRKKYKTSSPIFEFQHQLFKGNTKEKDDSIQYTAVRLSDCSIDILYSIEDDSVQYNSKTKHRLKLYSSSEGYNLIEFTSEELTQLHHFKVKLTNYKFTFWGNDKDLTDLRKFLFQKKSPKIRQCHALGYERKSNCFVFSKFLYDPQGKRFDINDEGYFEKQKVAPFPEKTIQEINEINIVQFLETLYQAYSYRGLTALGFWISSLFSHVVFDKFSFFPFLSMYGDSRCGKSDLTKMLNRCFFIDWEGLSMTTANTKKGELRKLSQKSSLVTPMLEGQKDKSRFDYDSILPMYNRNSTQVRARNTNDNETYELPFEGTLAFVQNNEQFTSKSAKERVISLHFQEQHLNDETHLAWQLLQEYSPEQLSFLGHSILSNRNFFEENLVSKIQYIVASMKENNVKIDRIAKNHAITLAGFLLISDLFELKSKKKSYKEDDLKEYVLAVAKRKIETARTENPLAELFFESLFELANSKAYIIKDHEIIVHLPTAEKELDYRFNKKDLLEAFRRERCEKRSTRELFNGKNKECWIFKTEDFKR